MNLRIAALLTSFFGFFVMVGTPAYASKSVTYTFGVVPQFDARHTHRVWRPLLTELEQRTGLKFRLVGSSSIPNFESQFLAGEFDFAYMNPYHVLKASMSQSYVPLVRDIGRSLYGVVVVRKDSPIRDMKELANKLVAFPSPNALGASLIPRADLKYIYGVSVEPLYVQSHSSVYLNVAMGKVDAGGGVQKTFDQQPRSVRDKLQIIYETRRSAPHPIAAHSNVSPAVRLSVQQALLALGKTAKGRDLLQLIPIKQIGVASMEDYRPLGEWGLQEFYKSKD